MVSFEQFFGLNRLSDAEIDEVLNKYDIVYDKNNKNLYEKIVEYASKFETQKDFSLAVRRLVNFNKYFLNSGADKSAERILEIVKSYDEKLIAKLFIENMKLVDNQKLSKHSAKKVIDEIFTLIKERNNNVNGKIYEEVGQIHRYLKELRKIGKIDKYPLNQEVISSIVSNCTSRLQYFWKKVKAEDFEKLLVQLSIGIQNNPKNMLSPEEIVTLSSKCATIFYTCNDQKINAVANELEEFKAFIINMYEKGKGNELYLDYLKTFEIRDVITKAPSIAAEDVSTLNFSTNFLMGKNFYEAIEPNLNMYSDVDKIKFKNLKNLKVNASFDELSRIYTSSVSSLGVLPENVAMVALFVNNVFKDEYNESVLEHLITGKNFVDLRDIKYKMLTEDNCLQYLAQSLPKDVLLSYLRQDLSILNMTRDMIKDKVEQALKTGEYVSPQEIVLKVLKSEVKTNIANKTKDTISNKNRVKFGTTKINFSGLNVDQLLSLANSLKISEETIQTWLGLYNEAALEQEIAKQIEEEQKFKQEEDYILNLALELTSDIEDQTNKYAKELENCTDYDDYFNLYKKVLAFRAASNLKITGNFEGLEKYDVEEDVYEKYEKYVDMQENVVRKITDHLKEIRADIDKKQKDIDVLHKNVTQYKKDVENIKEYVDLTAKLKKDSEKILIVSESYKLLQSITAEYKGMYKNFIAATIAQQKIFDAEDYNAKVVKFYYGVELREIISDDYKQEIYDFLKEKFKKDNIVAEISFVDDQNQINNKEDLMLTEREEKEENFTTVLINFKVTTQQLHKGFSAKSINKEKAEFDRFMAETERKVNKFANSINNGTIDTQKMNELSEVINKLKEEYNEKLIRFIELEKSFEEGQPGE